MLDFLEVEEFVGRHWHRWASSAASYPDHPEAAVRLETLRPMLGVFFRAGGGEAGIDVAAIAGRNSSHRLSLRQRLGLDEEVLDQARRDEESLLLPPRIALFAEASLNRDLYLWLVAYLAATQHVHVVEDPLQQDLLQLREVNRATRAVLAHFPGLAQRHARLCQALLAIRPQRKRLPPMEAALESVLCAQLGETPPEAGWAEVMHIAILDETLSLDNFHAPHGYRPPLPVPLWGQAVALGTHKKARTEQEDDEAPVAGKNSLQDDHGKRKADRREQDQADRDDSLMLNASEKMLSWAEMVNLNRHVEDEDDDEAKQAADQIDEIVLSANRKKAASKLKLDLDLAPGEVSGGRLRGRHTYPEWNHRKQIYMPDHCVVLSDVQSEEGRTGSRMKRQNGAFDESDASLKHLGRVVRRYVASWMAASWIWTPSFAPAVIWRRPVKPATVSIKLAVPRRGIWRFRSWSMYPFPLRPGWKTGECWMWLKKRCWYWGTALRGAAMTMPFTALPPTVVTVFGSIR
ncbi:hypothetical protein [Halomonas sp. PA16-9]|uniref:hypothetical protein n=1 Tax=Halomonas sp. PA16-9 TaxID=2576841 RepID=UPI0030EE8E96